MIDEDESETVQVSLTRVDTCAERVDRPADVTLDQPTHIEKKFCHRPLPTIGREPFGSMSVWGAKSEFRKD